MIMQNRISKKTIVIALLAGVAFAAPSAVMAQQLAPEWSPLDDGDTGYGGEATSEPAPKEEKARSRRGSGRDGPRVDVTPYLEVQQVAVTSFNDNSNDVLTYTTVAAGIDASIQTRRAEGQVNVRYERLIAYDDGVDNQDTVSGLARGSVKVAPGLSFEAGAIATRSKLDGRGPSPTNLVGNPDNISQVYSVYAGPTFSTNVGGLSVNAAYRAGYTKVESKDVGPLPPGQEPFDTFDDSISHSATASVGMQPGDLPFGWSVGAGYDREDAGQLDSRFEGKYVRGDVTVPVGAGLAVVGGIGYEDIEISERDALRDAAGDPLIDGDGRLITDPASPRLTAYQEDGLIWDVGVVWRPSSRTSVSAYYGQRYGSDTFGGSLTYQPNNNFAVNVGVFDQVTGFGNLLNDSLANLPTSFRAARNPLSGDLSGCAFSEGGGNCFGGVLQTANSASFRNRGVTAAVSTSFGGWDAGVAAGYSRRTYLASLLGARADLAGLVDENYFALASLGKTLDSKSRFDTAIYGTYFDPGFAGAGDVLGLGANAAYYRQIIRGLSATAAVGVDSFRQEDFDRELTASALVGLRYSF
jgi:hypothetical protein